MSKTLFNELKNLEQQSRLLEPELHQRAQWNEATLSYAQNFLAELPLRKTWQDESHDHAPFNTYFDEPVSLDDALAQISRHVDNAGIDTASGRYLGFIPGGGLYPAALGDYIAAVSNRYSGIFLGAPGAVRMENQIIRWMADTIGFPKVATGNLTSGGSMANLIALVTAREASALAAKDYHRAVIYLTKNTHTSAQKALRVIGMTDAVKRYIPVDECFAMDMNALKDAIQADLKAGLMPWMIYASAGTTDTGSVDALNVAADLALQHQVWLHVDAAYGGFFALTATGKKLFAGLERADSVTLDPHKSLFLPYGCGAVLVRHAQLQRNAFTEYAAYLQDCVNATDELSPCDLSPELTRHFRALRVWLPLMLFGARPFRAALDEKLLLARYFYQEIQQIPGMQVACVPQLSVVTFRYVPKNQDANEFNAALLKMINEDGRVYLSSTRLQDCFYLRMAVLSFRTHLYDIELAIRVIKEKI